MNAIVCDKCGKVVLLPDDELVCMEGISTLFLKKQKIDLCDECAGELVAAVRKGE